MSFEHHGYRLAAGEGEGIWFLNTLMTVKAGAEQTRGAFTLIEQLSPPGFAAPPHVHLVDDEAFYVLAGELRVTCGADTWTVAPGGFVMLPRGVAHAFVVTSPQGATLLQITAPAQFERFAAEAGEPARAMTLPPPGPPNLERLLAAAQKYGAQMVGEPPAP